MPHDCDIDADDMSEVPTSNGCTFCDRVRCDGNCEDEDADE